jgi:hypothetical protein
MFLAANPDGKIDGLKLNDTVAPQNTDINKYSTPGGLYADHEIVCSSVTVGECDGGRMLLPPLDRIK